MRTPATVKTAVDQMDVACRIREPNDLKLEFRYAIMGLLGGPAGRRLAVQLLDPRAYTLVRGFIERRYPVPPTNALRRFLRGEFTDGIEPVKIPALQRMEIAKLLRVMDVIEGMAADHDGRAKGKKKK